MFMRQDFLRISGKTTLTEVANRMVQERAERALIVDHADRPQGMVARFELARTFPTNVNPFAIDSDYVSSRLVSEIMNRNLVTVTRDTPLEDAAELLHTQKCGALIVTHNGLLAGVLDELDILRAFVELFTSEKATLRITVEINDPQLDLLELVFNLAKTWNLRVTGCQVLTHADKRIGVLRISGQEQRGFTDELWRSGLKLINVRR